MSVDAAEDTNADECGDAPVASVGVGGERAAKVERHTLRTSRLTLNLSMQPYFRLPQVTQEGLRRVDDVLQLRRGGREVDGATTTAHAATLVQVRSLATPAFLVRRLPALIVFFVQHVWLVVLVSVLWSWSCGAHARSSMCHPPRPHLISLGRTLVLSRWGWARMHQLLHRLRRR